MIKTFSPIRPFELHPLYISYGREDSGLFYFHLEVFCIARGLGERSFLKVYYSEDMIAQAEEEGARIHFCLLFIPFTIRASLQKLERIRERYQHHFKTSNQAKQ